MVKKNNKGRVAGSGTVSLVRKERYKLACQERDRLLAEAKTEEDKAKAYLVQKEWQRKPLEKTTRSSGAAASSSEVKKEEKKAAPCQKEQDKSLPCQKESEKSWVDVAKAQASKPLAWKKKEENNEGKDGEEKKGEVKKEEKKAAPCQKEPAQKEGGETAASCQKKQHLGPSQQQKQADLKKGQRISLSPSSSTPSPEPKRAKQPCHKEAGQQPCQKDAGKQPCQKDADKKIQWVWIEDGRRWLTKEEASKRVAIDWHNTLQKEQDLTVHHVDRQALKLLQDKGYYLILLSYAGKKRAKEVMEELEKQDLMGFFQKIRFTWKKCGHQGKAEYCRANAIDYLFDDSPEIIEECHLRKVYTYNMHTRWYQHTAGHWNFWEAVNQFLVDMDME